MQRQNGAVVNGVDQAVEVDGAVEALVIMVVFRDMINMNVIVTLQTDCVFGKPKTVDILYMYIIKQNAFYWEYFLLLF